MRRNGAALIGIAYPHFSAIASTCGGESRPRALHGRGTDALKVALTLPDMALPRSETPLEMAMGLLGEGDGTFARESHYAIRDGAASLLLVDVDGDHKPDLLTAGGYHGDVTVMLNRRR